MDMVRNRIKKNRVAIRSLTMKAAFNEVLERRSLNVVAHEFNIGRITFKR